MRIRNFAVVLAFFITIAPAAAQTVQVADQKPYVLLGTWTCESIAHSVGSWKFSVRDDGSLHMTDFFKTQDGVLGSFDESYRYDAASGQWHWNSTFANDPGFTEGGTAGAWLPESNTWIFDGSAIETWIPPTNSIRNPRFSKQDQRMVYTLRDDNAFRRDFEIQRGGRWFTTSASTCKRSSSAT